MMRHWKQKAAVLLTCTMFLHSVVPVTAATLTEELLTEETVAEATLMDKEVMQITGFVPFEEEDCEVVFEPKKPLEEVIAKLGDTLEVYVEGSETPISIDVEWECMQDYEASEEGTYYFVPVWDTQSYEISQRADIPQKKVMILDEIYEIPELTYLDIEDEESVPELLSDSDYFGPDYGTLPEKYDPIAAGGTGMPVVRDQNPYGTCWAFSSLGMAEVNQYVKHKKTVDLSELHLAYFGYNTVNDPLGGLEGDSNAIAADGTGKTFLSRGGNLSLSYYVLASWTGAAAEQTAPYEDAADAVTNGLDDSIAYDDVMHLQGAYKINIAEEPDVAKQMITQYGGIGCSYYSNTSYYDDDYYSYYNKVNTSTNHAIMIVGWDDNFPKENFHTPAPENGAWLIRNSWGGYGSYSYYSYFWLSYADTSLNDTAYVFSYEDADNYDHNYQYDGSMSSTRYGIGSSEVKAANIFTAKANPEGREVLKAVAFETAEANVTYEINVYLNPTNPKNPESGTKVESACTQGITSLPGYYTVDLKESVKLEQGDVFAIVIKYSKASGNVRVMLETDTDTWYVTNASIKPGQSFAGWMYGNSTSWADCTQYGGNVRIKAFTDNFADITDISLDTDKKELLKGESFTIGATTTPENRETYLEWKSSNPEVATVDKNGNVQALKGGTTTITASANGISVSCVVTVKAPATSLTLSSEAQTLAVGNYVVLKANVLPEDFTDTLVWESSDESVAQVDENGRVTAMNIGTATIRATAGSCSAQCVITVTKAVPVTGISLDVEAKTLDKGETDRLYVTVAPADATTMPEWSSSKPSVVSVDESGNIKALKAGNALITVSADGISASCMVTVRVPATSIELYQASAMMKVGESMVLQAELLPADCTDSIVWESQDATVATVNEKGRVQALKSGSTVITASANGMSAACVIKVEEAVTDITLAETNKTISLGEEVYLNAWLTPADSTAVMTWDSSDESTVTVDANGRIKGVGAGTAVITVSAGTKKAQCTVTVTFPFSDVSVIKGNWKYDSIAYVYANGIMNGISGTDSFRPDASLTRSMFATVLYRMAGSPDVTYSKRFSDVEDGKWYSAPIIWANDQKIVAGLSDGSYGIDMNITREQIAKMLCEYAKSQGYDVSVAASLAGYTDDETVSGWAVGYMQWAVGVGMISGKPNGDGSFRLDPKGEATRAECAAMLKRFQDKYNN